MVVAEQEWFKTRRRIRLGTSWKYVHLSVYEGVLMRCIRDERLTIENNDKCIRLYGDRRTPYRRWSVFDDGLERWMKTVVWRWVEVRD